MKLFEEFSLRGVKAGNHIVGWPVQYGWWLTRREGLLRKPGLRR